MRGRMLAVGAAVLTAGAVGAGVVSAQAPAPVLTVELGARAVTVGTPAPAAGPTRIEASNPSRRAPAELAVAALRRARRSPVPVKRVATLEAGGSAPPGGRYVTTIDLKPNTTYVVLNASDDNNPARFPLATLTVGGTANGAARPAPAATVGLYDYAFAMPSELPRNGTVRFENRGERLHIAVAFPVRSGRNRAAAVRALISGNERQAGRLLNFQRGFGPLGLVSGGAVADVEVTFDRPGNWVFACFIEDGEPGNPEHNAIGMVKAFRVR